MTDSGPRGFCLGVSCPLAVAFWPAPAGAQPVFRCERDWTLLAGERVYGLRQSDVTATARSADQSPSTLHTASLAMWAMVIDPGCTWNSSAANCRTSDTGIHGAPRLTSMSPGSTSSGMAWMQTEVDDDPAQGDLVFRLSKLRKMPLPLAATVCPTETPAGKERGTTCSTCQFYWRT